MNTLLPRLSLLAVVCFLQSPLTADEPQVDDEAANAEGRRLAMLLDRFLLSRPVDFTMTDHSKESCLHGLCNQEGLRLEIDRVALATTGIDLDSRISVDYEDTPLYQVFTSILDSENYPDVSLDRRADTIFLTSVAARQRFLQAATPGWLDGQHAEHDDLGRIWHVHLGETVDDSLAERLAGLPGLRSLSFSGPGKLTLAGIDRLSRIDTLRRIELHRFGRPATQETDWSADEALELLSQQRSLQQILADNCGISDRGVKALGLLHDLTTLSLRQNQITDEGLPTIGGLRNLESLDLGCYVRDANYGKNDLTNAGLEHLKDLTNLEYFNVEGTGANSLVLELPNLKSLALGSAFRAESIRDRDLFLLQQYPNLETLDIHSDSISDLGVAALGRLTKLRNLSLQGGSITDKGVKVLQHFALETLTLRGVQLTDEGIGYIARIPSLRSLTLMGSGSASIDGLLQLKALPRLRKLWLFGLNAPGSRLPLAGLDQLHELFFESARLQYWTQEDLDQLGELLPNADVRVGTGAGIYQPRSSGASWMTIPPRPQE